MSFLNKYKILIILIILIVFELIMLFKLNITDINGFFFNWMIIGILLFAFNILNIIKSNPFLELFSRAKKISNNTFEKEKYSFSKKLFDKRSITYFLFILLNFMLFLFT